MVKRFSSDMRNGSVSDDSAPLPTATRVRQSAVDPNADLVQFYFRDIRPISSVITLENEQHLARAVQQGKQARSRLLRSPDICGEDRARLESLITTGENARQQLIIANTRLVVSVAKNYQGRGLS